MIDPFDCQLRFAIASELQGAGQCTVQPGHQCGKVGTENLAFDISYILGKEERRLISRSGFILSVVAMSSFSVVAHVLLIDWIDESH